MNFLAHTFLSFSDEQLVGNMIGDFVGNRDGHLPEGIRQGIALHRAIDSYTDSHARFREAKKVFQPLVRLYSGAFVDVAFDYFLANDPGIKSEEEWQHFTTGVYRVLQHHEPHLPERFRKIFPGMQKDNWLYNYRYDWGMEYSIRNVLNKAQYLDAEMPVYAVFQQHKDFLKTCFEDFFPDLHAYSRKVGQALLGGQEVKTWYR